MEQQIAEGLIYFVVFLLSTTLHEAAHAWTSHRLGDSTAYHGGQVSLSPIPHIRRSPVGMLLLPLVSAIASGWPIGFASAPYNVKWAYEYPRRAALMALAGPAANLGLFLAAALAIRLGTASGIFFAPQSVKFGHIIGVDGDGMLSAAAFLLGAIFSMNLLLCVFNLLPVPPLDGSGAIPIFLNNDLGRRYLTALHRAPGLLLVGLFFAWKAIDLIFHPLFLGAVNLLYPGVTYG